MCGIFGILNRDMDRIASERLVKELTDLMFHRGPDDSGIFIDGNIGFGHRRLSIIDLKSGHQPMVNETSGGCIVYNGEIYNYKELAEKLLVAQGIGVETSSDTEVLLKLLDFDKLELLEELNGMFAFGFWDSKRKSLMLVRDRLGIKPLYYLDLGKSFIFSSEIKPLIRFPGYEKRVNERRIPEYLAFRNISGEETFFKGILEVPAGYALILRPPDYKLTMIKFWNEGLNDPGVNCRENAQNLEKAFSGMLFDSIRMRLISDVPVGTYNSGGVDSSLVTALVRQFKKDELHTFSVGFKESSHDERRYSDIVSRMYKTTHHAIVVGWEEYAKELEKTLWHLEEPINHAHTVQIRILSRLAREYVTVVLTGEGADEVFGGYPRYNIVKFSKLAKTIPSFARSAISAFAKKFELRRVLKLSECLGLSEEELIINNSRLVPLSALQLICLDDTDIERRLQVCNERLIQNLDGVSKLLYYDQRTYLPALLNRLDKMSMAASIEARVPFLDYRIVEWSYKIRADMKIRGFTNKWLVRKVAEKWLPKTIINRKKYGFDVPVADWMREKNGLGMYLELLRERRFKEREYFDGDVVERFVEEHLTGKKDHSDILWGLMNLEIWFRVFVDDVGL